MIGKCDILRDVMVVLVANHTKEIEMSDNAIIPYYI